MKNPFKKGYSRPPSQTFYDSNAFRAPWVAPGMETINYGDTSGPRLSAIGEFEYNCPRTWPAQYQWRLMGLGAMPLFQLGYTAPTFNNQMSPMSVGYNTIIPGISRTPFGGN
jgi:hypothetical protein